LKKAIIKSIYLQILATKKRKLWSKLVTMQLQDGKNNYSIFHLQIASKTARFLERKFFGFRKKPSTLCFKPEKLIYLLDKTQIFY